jgi:hypothetical protein
MEIVMAIIFMAIGAWLFYKLGYHYGLMDGRRDIMQMHTRKKLKSTWRGVKIDE